MRNETEVIRVVVQVCRVESRGDRNRLTPIRSETAEVWARDWRSGSVQMEAMRATGAALDKIKRDK